jgi:tRNA threonylcarbamoyladenosine biosynthesis protein TsaE
MVALGERLGRASRVGAVVFLQGDLGAGKTTLVRGWLRGLGYPGPVKSPTYTLVEPYTAGGLEVYHVDLYRVADPEELEYLGLREELRPGTLCLVEWPERGAGWLPGADLEVRIEVDEPGRVICFTARTPAGQSVLEGLQS